MPGLSTEGDSSSRYLNRELSWLAFDERVLDLAADTSLPLLERARFLAIFARNLDEFFQIRVSELQEQRDLGVGVVSSDGLSAFDQLRSIRAACVDLGTRAQRLLEDDILPALEAEGIRFLGIHELTRHQLSFVQRHFDELIFPVLTPLSVDPAHPFPYVSDLSLNIAALVTDPDGENRRFARVKVPQNLGRFIRLPDDAGFLLLERVIGENIGRLFPGMRIVSRHTFRVTRDGDLEMRGDGNDLVEMVRSGLERRRRTARAVRLEFQVGMDEEVRDLLLRELGLGPGDAYELAPLPPDALWHLDVERPGLRYPTWVPSRIEAFSDGHGGQRDPFVAVGESDVLVHHPYDSFADSVAAFVERAATDPDVLTIKQTLYRTSAQESAIIASLLRAAEAGKQVVVLVELKARFDEETNLSFAEALERAGAHVVYGIVGLKAHAKLLLVIRREAGALRTYVHIGTGNYNPVTSRMYEDFGLFTSNRGIGESVAEAFNLLTGYGRWSGSPQVLLAPYELRDAIKSLIEGQAKPGGRIVMKMNSLVDPRLIDALCHASQKGAEIDLIVRGICCLRPGANGVSDGIRVRSIVGRYLEHSRVFRFGTGGRSRYLIGSADLMPRNLDGRVEALVSVRDPAARLRIDRVLELALADDMFAWELAADGTWDRVPRVVGIAMHDHLMADAAEGRVEPVPRSPRRIALVRHAVAEDRGTWVGIDDGRPLSDRGRAQAREIAQRLASSGPLPIIRSSPARRCVDTVQPLAEALGVPVVVSEELAEGRDPADLIRSILESDQGEVVCSHGDVIRGAIERLSARGAVIVGDPLWTKGSIWWIEFDMDGTIRLRAEPPPDELSEA